MQRLQSNTKIKPPYQLHADALAAGLSIGRTVVSIAQNREEN